MPVTIHVNGSANSLVHKGSNGIASSTIPDVCKTPSPAGPVPIPYPVIISMSSDLDKGSTTVKADGGNMIAIKDCEFSRCTGDEAGTVGGVVSSTFGKEAKFILYSFDVKIDGGNACRLSDKMTMNHQNTMCLGGVIQLPVIPQGLTPEQKVACAIHCCDNAVYDKKTKHKDQGEDCRSLSCSKHSCVMHSLRRAKDSNVDASPRFQPSVTGADRVLIPDVIINGNTVIDAKFPCKTPLKKRFPMKGSVPSDMSVLGHDMLGPKETDDYKLIPGCEKTDATAMTPKDAESKKGDCKCDYEDVDQQGLRADYR